MKKSLLLIVIIIFNTIIFPQFKVEITVVTNQLKENENVFICGNTQALGNWNPELIKLVKINDSTWNRVFEFVGDIKLEFKFTKGDWHKEALDENGKTPGNILLTVTYDTSLMFHINHWSANIQISRER